MKKYVNLIQISLNVAVSVEQKDLLAVLLPGKAPTIQKCIII